MNCRETEALLRDGQAGESGPAGRLELRAHLSACPACAAEARRLTAARATGPLPHYPSVWPALAAPKAGRWPMVALAAVACVVAFVAIGTLLRSGGTGSTMTGDVVSAHIRSLQANRLVDISSPDAQVLTSWFSEKMDFALNVKLPEGFDLVGGRLDYLVGHHVAALVYRFQQHTVTLFTWPTSGPEEAPELESIQGLNAIHWVRGGVESWAVSDLGEEVLKRLAAR